MHSRNPFLSPKKGGGDKKGFLMGGAVAQFRVDETCAGKGCARSITALARFARLWCSCHTPCFAALRGRHIALLDLKLPKKHRAGAFVRSALSAPSGWQLPFGSILRRSPALPDANYASGKGDRDCLVHSCLPWQTVERDESPGLLFHCTVLRSVR